MSTCKTLVRRTAKVCCRYSSATHSRARKKKGVKKGSTEQGHMSEKWEGATAVSPRYFYGGIVMMGLARMEWPGSRLRRGTGQQAPV